MCRHNCCNIRTEQLHLACAPIGTKHDAAKVGAAAAPRALRDRTDKSCHCNRAAITEQSGVEYAGFSRLHKVSGGRKAQSRGQADRAAATAGRPIDATVCFSLARLRPSACRTTEQRVCLLTQPWHSAEDGSHAALVCIALQAALWESRSSSQDRVYNLGHLRASNPLRSRA